MYNKNDYLIPVCIYCDSTGLFSETEIFNDNLTEMFFPIWIVQEWYKEHEKDFIEACKTDSLKEPCFETWINEVYTADDTDGLYNYAVEKGYDPKFEDNINNIREAIVYENENCETVVAFKGTYLECRKWAKKHEWKLEYWYTSLETLEEETKEVDLEMLFG